MNATFENPVDRENHIVRGVKVLGFTSANGRIYDFAAVKEAIQKYEKAPVNKDHNMEEPSFSDRLGWLENVTLQKDGLYADFHYNPHADGIESFLWFAEHNGLGDVGFSHLVSGKYSVDPDGTERITRIDKVKSVDLVANPATTKTIFESEVKPMPKKAVKESEWFSKGHPFRTKVTRSDLKKLNDERFKLQGKVDDTVFKTNSERNNAQGYADIAHEMYEEALKLYKAQQNKGSESMKENNSDFKIVEKMSGTKDDNISKREKTYDLYYKGKFIGWVDDLAKAWRIEKEYANKKGSESMKEAEKEKGLEVYGTKGMNNTRFRKTFKSQKEYEKWYDKNEGDIEILGLRDLEGDSKHEQEDDDVGEAGNAANKVKKNAIDRSRGDKEIIAMLSHPDSKYSNLTQRDLKDFDNPKIKTSLGRRQNYDGSLIGARGQIEKAKAKAKAKEQEDDDDSGLTDKEKADNLRAAKLQDRKMAASRRKNSGDDDGRRGYGPTGTTRTNRARRRESVKEAKQPSQGSEMTVKQLTDLFKDGEWEAYSDVVPNKHVTLVNKNKNKKVNVLVREQEGDDEMDKEKMMEDENPMQQEEAEQDPMMDEADDVYAKIKEVCEGEGSDEEKSKIVLEMLGLSGGMSEGEEPMEEADDEEMKEDDDEEMKEDDDEEMKEDDDEEMKEDDDEDPRKESKSELKSLRKWKSEKLKQEKIVNLIKESNLEPTKVFVKQLSAIDSKLWGEAIRDRRKVALTRSAVKPISSGSQSRSESSYKQFLESVLGK